MKKAWTLLALLLLGCTAAISHRVTPTPDPSRESAKLTGTAGAKPADQSPTDAGTWLIYFAEQGVELAEIIAIFGPPNTGWKGPLDWRNSPDHWQLHQWDHYGVWVETGWDDGVIRDMGFGKVIRFYGGDGPGF
jgi:hypothetical protein